MVFSVWLPRKYLLPNVRFFSAHNGPFLHFLNSLMFASVLCILEVRHDNAILKIASFFNIAFVLVLVGSIPMIFSYLLRLSFNLN